MPVAFMRREFLAAVIAVWGATSVAQAQQGFPLVAAASDLQFAIEDLVTDFTAQTGIRVRISIGATGNLARQIREGAPFDIFMAADEAFIADLHAKGLTQDEGHVFATGQLVIMVPHGSTLAPDAALDSLETLLAEGKLARFAMANPEHAPYGARAREALITRGLWDDIQPFLVMGENVSQAAAFALSGNAEGGLIAYPLALAPQVATRGSFALINKDWHSPLRKRMALLRDASPEAQAFYDYLQSPAAREIMARHGLVQPEE